MTHPRCLKLCLLFSAVLLALPARAQVMSNDRFELSPLRIHYGVGSIRLEGMGGFLVAVPDENNEINLNDFGENPAGFGDDRESWVMESRYSHREFSQPSVSEGPIPFGAQDLRTHEAVLHFGKYAPHKYGAGVGVDVSGAKTHVNGDYELQPRDLQLPAFETFSVFNFNFVINRYLSPSFTTGASLDLNSESSASHTRDYYDIDHDAAGARGGLGAAWTLFPGFTIGGKGELVSNKIDGTSEDGNHLDKFTWERPTSVVSGHAFLKRGRLNLGLDYASKDASGFESVVTSWSNRFQDNPGDEEISQELDAFSEDRTATKLRVRGAVNVSPRVYLAGMYVDQDVDFTVVSIPNVRGSWEGQDVSQASTTTVFGLGWKLMSNRLLLATEFASETNDLTVVFPDLRLDIQDTGLDVSTWRVGGEYFLSETLLLRGGVIRETETLDINDYPRGGSPSQVESGDYTTTRLATGFGLVPKGGILQVDVNVDTVLSSDLDQRHINAGAYVKYLF